MLSLICERYLSDENVTWCNLIWIFIRSRECRVKQSGSWLSLINNVNMNLIEKIHHTSSIHHYPPQCCTTRQKLEAKGSHQPSSSATPLAPHQSANFIQNLCPHVQHPFRVIPALHVILGHTVHKCWIEIESPLVCQMQLLNPAHVQLIWSTSVRRCWFIGVEQTTCLPPSLAIYRIIQN